MGVTDRLERGAEISTLTEPSVFRLSPLIRITLLCLYVALTAPLPFGFAVAYGGKPSKERRLTTPHLQRVNCSP